MNYANQRLTGVVFERYVAKYRLSEPSLPPPRVESWDWQLEASCRNLDTAIFFPATGLRGRELARYEQDAKDVCGNCPVMRECRLYAVNAREPHGIWGGMTTRERAMLSLLPRWRRLAFLAPASAGTQAEESRGDHGYGVRAR